MSARLLDAASAFVARFVVLPSDAAETAVALFVLHTWALDAAASTPYLAVVSPEKQTGKSRMLEVTALIVREPWHTVSTTEAALFRKIERDRPTLLLDEIDAIFGSHVERTEPLRAALNGGNRRGATVARTVGKGAKLEVQDFSIFCPKILAGIDTGRLPDTIRDRSITVHMKRRHNGEQVERLRHTVVADDAAALRADLETWATDAVDLLRDALPELPDALSDRAADGWEPLLAIADLAGGEWPDRARTAAVELSAQADDDEASLRTLLLAATRAALGDLDRISTVDLLAAINAEDELPFGGWNDGRGLDSRGLAKLLKPYGVKPTVLRIGAGTPRGYRVEDLRDTFARYLRPQRATSGATDSANKDGDVALLHSHIPPVRKGAIRGAEGQGVRRSATSATCADNADPDPPLTAVGSGRHEGGLAARAEAELARHREWERTEGKAWHDRWSKARPGTREWADDPNEGILPGVTR